MMNHFYLSDTSCLSLLSCWCFCLVLRSRLCASGLWFCCTQPHHRLFFLDIMITVTAPPPSVFYFHCPCVLCFILFYLSRFTYSVCSGLSLLPFFFASLENVCVYICIYRFCINRNFLDKMLGGVKYYSSVESWVCFFVFNVQQPKACSKVGCILMVFNVHMDVTWLS